MPGKILCVAEKNSISKAVSEHLSGGRFQTSNTANQYVKNYSFDFNFGPPWGNCEVVMTAVSGHMTSAIFPPEFKDWTYPPPESLFTAQVLTIIDEDKQSIAANIKALARGAKALFIWTDCDREGEHIGGEVRAAAWAGKPNLPVKRARFSNIERAHILNAARNPVDLDQRQIDAVATRIELDLRIGYAFTRFLTKVVRSVGPALAEKMISYAGSCQFPTLGFVVDRYWRVKNFVPEPFWSIKVMHNREDIDVRFSWRRNHLFDRAVVIILYERCIAAKLATVTKVEEKPTKKFKPFPLTTVELQKAASYHLRMNGEQVMAIAEKLYQRGFISYPRTETDRFDRKADLKSLVAKQFNDPRWGAYSQNLINNDEFQWPREGRHDDKAHPPIHPVIAAPGGLDAEEARVYEFITRRFLACCSKDALGQQTTVEIEYGDETFHTHGLIVLERNYLDVYPYDRWTSSSILPQFTLGEKFEPTEAMITDGQTSAPSYLTEPDLIALMDANGIGTDATMAEHISKIKDREYVITRPKAGGGARNNDGDEPAGRGARGGRGDRGGRDGGRGGAAGGNGAGGMVEFIPTTLGVALIDGYEKMEFESSLSKPFLRKEMELSMKAICEGRLSAGNMLRNSIRQYKDVFMESKERRDLIKQSCRKYVLGQ